MRRLTLGLKSGLAYVACATIGGAIAGGGIGGVAVGTGIGLTAAVVNKVRPRLR